MKVKILGFSTGAYGRLDGPVFLLASGSDVELREGDEIEITVTRPASVAKDVEDWFCKKCGKPNGYHLIKCHSCLAPRRLTLPLGPSRRAEMDRLIVTIKNPDHPHYPKRGYIEVKNNKVKCFEVHGQIMYTVNFDDGTSGMATYHDCKLERRLQIEARQFRA